MGLPWVISCAPKNALNLPAICFYASFPLCVVIKFNFIITQGEAFGFCGKLQIFVEKF